MPDHPRWPKTVWTRSLSVPAVYVAGKDAVADEGETQALRVADAGRSGRVAAVGLMKELW
jgi:hypothetical protein